MILRIETGDITELQVDAIVNAANKTLLGGRGVDGAIHRAAGPELRKECETLHGCETGQSKITKGYQLPAKYVIHTVGPIWQDGKQGERELLAGCYRTALELAKAYQLSSIAFPAISTGVYRFPKVEAAKIAVRTIRSMEQDFPADFTVLLCAFDEETQVIYEHVLAGEEVPDDRAGFLAKVKSLFTPSKQDLNEQVDRLKQALNESRYTVAITGAGISFSAGGMNFDHENIEELMPLASEDVLRNDSEKYYKLLDHAFLHSMFTYEPSPAHKALRSLEKDGLLQGIITTNVDCMHTMAGSENVAEIQGSLQVNRCTKCGKHFDDYRIWNQGKVPHCDVCGDVIWTFPFYSHVGLHEENLKKAQAWMAKADLILVIGANGSYGGAYFNYRKPSAKIIQINPGKTAFDRIATLNIRATADEVLQKVIDSEKGDETK